MVERTKRKKMNKKKEKKMFEYWKQIKQRDTTVTLQQESIETKQDSNAAEDYDLLNYIFNVYDIEEEIDFRIYESDSSQNNNDFIEKQLFYYSKETGIMKINLLYGQIKYKYEYIETLVNEGYNMIVAKTHEYFDGHQNKFKEGYNYFAFSNSNKYLKWLLELPIQQRTCHEIMCETKSRYEFYDLDIKLMSIPEKVKNEILSQSNPSKYVFEKFSKIRENIFNFNNIPSKFLNNDCYVTESPKIEDGKLVKILLHILYRNVLDQVAMKILYGKFDSYLKKQDFDWGFDQSGCSKNHPMRTIFSKKTNENRFLVPCEWHETSKKSNDNKQFSKFIITDVVKLTLKITILKISFHKKNYC